MEEPTKCRGRGSDKVLTVVMYHYVRPIASSRYPGIKGLERSLFAEQVAYIMRHYHPVAASDVISSVRTGKQLPNNAVLLTFDDGLLDHFTEVFPVLERQGIPGCFFPPAKCVLEREILDVHRIHFILAAASDAAGVATELDFLIRDARDTFTLDHPGEYRQRFAVESRMDPAHVVYVKRMLQVGLPAAAREAFCQKLFEKYVSVNPCGFAEELYMNEAQVRCMAAHNMTIGSHGYDHVWMDSLDRLQQTVEIDRSLEFLNRVGVPTNDWVMCYPYGVWNPPLLEILEKKGCALGFTTEVALAQPGVENRYTLPRLDTNDLPKSASAEPSPWTRAVLGVS